MFLFFWSIPCDFLLTVEKYLIESIYSELNSLDQLENQKNNNNNNKPTHTHFKDKNQPGIGI